MNKSIFIAGSGGIGEAAALLLREWSETDVTIILGDISESNLSRAVETIKAGSAKTTPVETVVMPRDGINDAMKDAFERADVLLDCSPGGQAPRMARFAVDHKCHYANLTEYVAETDEIIRLGENAETGLILQTGLAPGFINVLAMGLYGEFVRKYENEQVERVAMKVGALTAHAHAPHFYGFTWSPIGVATEYVKNSRVIRDFEITECPALSDREVIVIGARTYEADLTSGGAADLPDHFKGKARSLDYKTLRYVGHYSWVESLIAKLDDGENLSGRLQEEMLAAVPSVEDDLVLVHAAVDGFDAGGRRRMVEKAYFVEPLEVNGHSLRAIQTTTAAPLCESAMMLLSGNYKGVLLQSKIDPKVFMAGRFVSKVYR
ncbi:MAG: saccharopine dehydrogenase NADP-binding domain-containing protein [Chloracidobacterium sp.]|nr:saccharopine dehydrogenase NADP-binding domain-containing protein [Chloracidobacterium sp.]MCC6826164.1 saccharopine dehydrogenase NADP-binding domain-containing protein [Acidobacteriota bacterium]MCO5333270.1 saccharopine dehydrogenase NADP-binding domain-containing protein [Pyrinomonadaceae bacterium]